MSFFDNILNVMNLNSDDYEDDDYMDDDYEEEEETPKKRLFSRSKSSEEEEEDETSKPEQKITPMRPTRRQSSGSFEVCVIKPTSVEDGREITDTLLSGRAVILNMEGLNVDIAQRIVDFTSGSCYAISGNFQKISDYIFIITPKNVDISGDFQNILDAFGTNSLHMNF